MSLRSLAALVAGAAIGLSLADMDRAFFFLTHRSIVTHGLLLPLLCFYLVQGRADWFRAGAAGLCLTMAVHLSFDLFPVGWFGYAVVHVPLWGRLDNTLSILWFLASMVTCSALALRLLDSPAALGLALAVAGGFFLFASRGEAHFWYPLLVLLLTFGAATLLPNPLVKGHKFARRLMRARMP